MGSEGRMLTVNNAEQLAQWCGGRAVMQHDALDESISMPAVNVPIGNTIRRAQVGDMIIRNHDGSFRIQKKDW